MAGQQILDALKFADSNNAYNYADFADGQNAAVSAASQGRLAYSVAAQKFVISCNAGAFLPIK